jgi:hypothetical protein
VGYSKYNGQPSAAFTGGVTKTSFNFKGGEEQTSEFEGTDQPGHREVMGYTDVNKPGEIGEIQKRQNAEPCGDGKTLGYSESQRRGTRGTESAGQQREPCFTSASKIMGNSERCGLSGEQRRWSGQEFENGYIRNETMADTERGEFNGSMQSRAGRYGFANGGSLADTDCQRGCRRDNSRESAKDVGESPWSAGIRDRDIKPGLGGSLNGIPYRLGIHIAPAPYGAAQYDWEPSRVAAGVKNKGAQIKCYGNAVQPQQIFPVVAEIAAIEYCRI